MRRRLFAVWSRVDHHGGRRPSGRLAQEGEGGKGDQNIGKRILEHYRRCLRLTLGVVVVAVKVVVAAQSLSSSFIRE